MCCRNLYDNRISGSIPRTLGACVVVKYPEQSVPDFFTLSGIELNDCNLVPGSAYDEFFASKLADCQEAGQALNPCGLVRGMSAALSV